MNTKAPFPPQRTLAMLTALVLAVTAVIATAALGLAAGSPSFARGVVIGGASTLVFLAIAFAWGSRGLSVTKVAAGLSDERERTMLERALAHGALGMSTAAAGCAVGALYGLPALAVAGIVIWGGVVFSAASFAVQSRRR